MITRGSEQQYIDLYKQCRTMIHEHSSDVMNNVRDEAFERFASAGFPSRKVERYKYTDIQKLFAPDYGLNLNRLQIPVDPYNAFRCDVPNLSPSLYFVDHQRHRQVLILKIIAQPFAVPQLDAQLFKRRLQCVNHRHSQ